MFNFIKTELQQLRAHTQTQTKAIYVSVVMEKTSFFFVCACVRPNSACIIFGRTSALFLEEHSAADHITLQVKPAA